MALTQVQQEQVERIRRALGDDAAEEARRRFEAYGKGEAVTPAQPVLGVDRPLVDPGPPPAREPVAEGDLMQSRADYLRDRMQVYKYVAASEEDARQLALRDLQRVGGPTEVGFVRRKAVVPADAEKRPWEFEGPRAILEALKQQPLETEEQAAERKALEQRGQEIRRIILEEAAGAERRGESREEHINLVLGEARQRFQQQMGPEEADQAFEQYLRLTFPERVEGWKEKIGRAITYTEREREEGKRYPYGLTLVKEEKSGPFVETLMGTGMRDVFGLMRLIVTPAVDALTYDVDESGRPVDPEDMAYRIEQAVRAGYKRLKGPDAELPPNLGASGLGVGLGPRPFQARTLDPGRAGLDYWQAVAKDIAQFRFLGNDFSDLPEYTKLYEQMGMPEAPFWIGMGAELALPVVPPVGKLARVGLEGAGSVAKAAKLERTAAALDAVAHPVLAARAGTTRRLVNAALSGVAEPEAAVGASAHSLRAMAAERLAREFTAARYLLAAKRPAEAARDAAVADTTIGRRLASLSDQQARTVLENYVAAVEGSSNPLTRRAWGWAEGALRDVGSTSRGELAKSMLDATLATGDEALLGAAEQILRSTGMDDVARAQALRRLANTATPSRAHELVAARELVRSKVFEELLHAVPEDMVFVTPTTVVSAKAWRQERDLVQVAASNLLRGELKGGRFTPANGQRLAREMVTALGPKVIAESDFWLPAWKALDAGESVTEQVYAKVVDLVNGNLWKRAVQDSTTLRWAGEQSKRAAVPLERRMPIFGDAATLARGIGDALARVRVKPGEVGAVVPRFVLRGHVPIEVANWYGSVREATAALTDSWRARLGQAVKQTGSGPAGFQKMLDEAQELALRGRAPEEAQEMLRDQWRRLVTIFWGAGKEVPSAFRENQKLIETLLPAEPISASAFTDLLETIRKEIPDLRGKGLSTGMFIRGDAVAEALTTWALFLERDNLVRQSARQLVEESPALQLPGRFLLGETVFGDIKSGAQAYLLGWVDQASLGALVADLDKAASSVAKAGGTINEDLFGALVNASWKGGPAPLDAIMPEVKTALDAIDLTKYPDASRKQIQAFVQQVKSDLLRPVYDFHVKTLDDWGLLRGAGKQQRLARTDIELIRIPGFGSLGGIQGEEAAKLAEEMRDITQGDLLKMLEPYLVLDRAPRLLRGETSVPKMADYALATAWQGWNLVRRVTVSGLLGGLFPPVTRFHAINAFTAPLIMSATVGPAKSAQAVGNVLRDIGRGGLDLLRFAGRGAPDEVLFTAANGRRWTRRALADAIERNNIRFSQSSFEFGDTVLKEILRTARTDSRVQKSFAPLGPRQVLRWLDPRHKNLWSRFAEISDGAFRRGVFTAALKEGRTEAEAAQLARNALLDYGDLWKWERRSVARVMMFYAFRRQMLVNAVQMLGRNPQAFRQMVALFPGQMQQAGVWALSPDNYQVRMWSYFSPKMLDNDSTFTAHYGMGNPVFESYQDLVAFFAWAANGFSLREAKMGAESFLFSPEMDLLQKIRERGTEEESQSWVDERWVAAAMQAGVWPQFVEAFDIEAVEPDKRQQGRPTFQGQQFRFGNRRAYDEWLVWQYLALRGGLDRTFRDYMTAAWSMGLMTPEGADLKRYTDEQGWENAIQYALFLDTPIKVSREMVQRQEALRAIQRELESSSR